MNALNAKSLEGQLLAALLRLRAASRLPSRIIEDLTQMLNCITDVEGGVPAHLEREHFEAMAKAVGLKFEPEPTDVDKMRQAAREIHEMDDVKIDSDAPVSVGDNGVWVEAQVFVPREYAAQSGIHPYAGGDDEAEG